MCKPEVRFMEDLIGKRFKVIHPQARPATADLIAVGVDGEAMTLVFQESPQAEPWSVAWDVVERLIEQTPNRIAPNNNRRTR